MRLTPAAASSRTENDFPLIPTHKIDRFRKCGTDGANGGKVGQTGGEKHISSSIFRKHEGE
jgi:hypothetical protein